MRSLTLGEREIIALTDSLSDYAPLADIFPEVLPEQWAPYRARYPNAFDPAAPDMWRATSNCYLVRSADSLTLIDTGVGLDDPVASPGKLMSELATCGVTPEQITTVVFTHLHSDHIGGNLTSEGAAAFPNAQYLFERAAWNAIHEAAKGGDPYTVQCSERLRALEALGVTRQFTVGAPIADGCISLSTDGHAQGHISVVVESRAGRALIVGDVFLHPAQVDEPEWASSYDEDIPLARATRGRLLDLAEADGLTLAVCHFPPDGFGRIIREGGARHWQAL